MSNATHSRTCRRFPLERTLGWLTLAAFGLAPAGAQNADTTKEKTAQSAEPAPNKDLVVQRLMQKIEDLEASQKRMQAKLDRLSGADQAAAMGAPPVAHSAGDPQTVASASAPAPSPAPAPPSGAAAATGSSATDPSVDSEQIHHLGPVEFSGFSDFDYGRPWFEKLPAGGLPGSTNSFNIGDFDLFTNTRISDHWSLLGELLITSDFTNEFGAELDRLMLTYTYNRYFKISFGKYNTAIGYYPTSFHRAHFFQTGIERPVMFADEDNGGILPVHSIGISATGKVPSGSWGLHWVAEIANGRSESTDTPIQNFVDENNGKAVNVALYLAPEWLEGLQVGASIYHDELHPAGIPKMQENIFSMHAVYVSTRFELLNEAAIVRHAFPAGPVFRTLTSYSQISKALGKYRPYFRYDYQNVPQAEPILGVLGRLNGPSIGLLRSLSSYVIVKVQYGRLSERGLSTANDAQAQLAIAF